MGRPAYRDLLSGEARIPNDSVLDELVLQLKALAEVTIDLWQCASTEEHLKSAERAKADEEEERVRAQIDALIEAGIPSADAARLASINDEMQGHEER